MSVSNMGHRNQDPGEFPEQLGRLMAAYRTALPDPEASPAFMPRMWDAIESRNRVTYSFSRFAKAFVSAAAAVSLGLAALTMTFSSAPVQTIPYVDALAGDVEDAEDAVESELI